MELHHLELYAQCIVWTQRVVQCPKLTHKHIYPNSFEKIRVKLATQVYSHTCSVAVQTLAEINKFSDRKLAIFYF